METELNPYAAPREDEPVAHLAAKPLGDPELQRIRRQNLADELTVVGIGSLFCLSATFFFFIAVLSGVPFALVVGACHLLIGLALRRLDGRARVFAMVFAVLGLLLFPLGTILSAYILRTLSSAQAELVSSRRYRDLVAATPEIEYRTPVRVWVMVAALVMTPFASIVFLAYAS